MQEFTVLYILYPSLEQPTHVYYLRKKPKEKAPNRIWNKLLGIGGKVEEKDGTSNKRLETALLRELDEELKEQRLKLEKPFYCGRVFVSSQNRFVHFYKAASPEKLPLMHIENEGKAQYYPINHHQKHPEEFPEGDLPILERVFYDNDEFDEIID